MKLGAIEITDEAIKFPVGTPLEQALRVYAWATLMQCNGDKKAAAKVLGIGKAELERRLGPEADPTSA